MPRLLFTIAANDSTTAYSEPIPLATPTTFQFEIDNPNAAGGVLVIEQKPHDDADWYSNPGNVPVLPSKRTHEGFYTIASTQVRFGVKLDSGSGNVRPQRSCSLSRMSARTQTLHFQWTPRRRRLSRSCELN